MDMFYLGWFWGNKCNENCKRKFCSVRILFTNHASPTCHTLSVFQTVHCTGGSTDPPKENGRKFSPTASVASKFRLGNTR